MRTMLITAGPTHEPIDAVRYIGNRSSGRLGIALADAAARRGWTVTLLLGPTAAAPSDSRVTPHRFRTTAELQSLLDAHFSRTDVLIMAAAVADYRPSTSAAHPGEKLRRSDSGLTLQLEPTPDLLAGCAARRQPGQLLIGFALEPRDRLLASAADKLARKELDLIVANPLETMDAQTIDATLLSPAGVVASTNVAISKAAFADWLLDHIEQGAGARRP